MNDISKPTTKILQQQITLCMVILSLTSCHLASSSKSSATKADDIPKVEATQVRKMRFSETVSLPGNLAAYQDVGIHGKAEGFISWIGVDRGSFVKKGELLIKIFAPEFEEKAGEADAKASTARSLLTGSMSDLQSNISKLHQLEAKASADRFTYTRLKQASKVPGAVAQNEVDVAQKALEADQSSVNAAKATVESSKTLIASHKSDVDAAVQSYKSLETMKDYLNITAPFDGVITERNVHVGSIVAINTARSNPLVRIQEIARLRLVVAVPEDLSAGTRKGTILDFTVPAYLGKTFHGIVARPAYSLDLKTRTMPVELDVPNEDLQLQPGMLATVSWSMKRPYDTMFVPTSALGDDLNGEFVDAVVNSRVHRVSVQKGMQMDDFVEVLGDLKPGDEVLLKANAEMSNGALVRVQEPAEQHFVAQDKNHAHTM